MAGPFPRRFGNLSSPVALSYLDDDFDALASYSSTAAQIFGLGDSVLVSNTVGTANTAFGYHALTLNTSGSANTAFGASALAAVTTDSGNTAFGYQALAAMTTRGGNTAMGYRALAASTTGANNVAVGYQAMESLALAGDNNTAVGYHALGALNGTTAEENVAIGTNALLSLVEGQENTAVGVYALQNENGSLTNGLTAVGAWAAYTQNGALRTTAFGFSALKANVTGNDCCAVGCNALVLATGQRNTALGNEAGNNLTSGANCTLLGYGALPSSPTVSNEVTLGDTNVTVVRTPSAQFQTSGSYRSAMSGAGDPQFVAYDNIVSVSSSDTPVATHARGMFMARDNTSGGISVGVMDSSGGVQMIFSGIGSVTFSNSSDTLQCKTTGGASPRNIAVAVIRLVA